jgi:glycosyltransferase involved in cell wall biosynthesis
MTPSSPLITIAICTRNRAALLEKAMRSVLGQMNGHAEILIVDNGSTDNTAQLAAEFSAADPRVRFFCEPRTGLSNARNLALRQAAGDWVGFLDDDAIAEPGWLAAYQNFFAALPNSRIACAGGAVTPIYETPPPRWLKPRMGCVTPTECRPCGQNESPWGCNFAVRRELALAAGGFNPNLGHSGTVTGAYEEVDLINRLRQTGGEVWWLVDARIKHLVQADRLCLKWRLWNAFRQGRCGATSRLSRWPAGNSRAIFIASRVVIAPFHGGINLLVALVTFPFNNGRLAVNALMRVAYIAGLTQELLRLGFGSNNNSKSQ